MVPLPLSIPTPTPISGVRFPAPETLELHSQSNNPKTDYPARKLLSESLLAKVPERMYSSEISQAKLPDEEYQKTTTKRRFSNENHAR